MAHALQRKLASIDVSDPHLYQDDTWRPLFEQLRRDDPVHLRNSPPVIASEAKQSIFAAERKNGLLRRFAPRNDGEALTGTKSTKEQE
jgi:hypothetical protein